MEVSKIEFQGLELDPNKTYIVNLHFDTDMDAEKRYYLFRYYKDVFEEKGITNIIFNPYVDKCQIDIVKTEE